MPKGTITSTDILKLILQNIALPAYGSNLYIALHTADPTRAGNQQSSECNYTGYSRILVSRDAAGWNVLTAITED